MRTARWTGVLAVLVLVAAAWTARAWAGTAGAPPQAHRWGLATDAASALSAATLCALAVQRAGSRRSRTAWRFHGLAAAVWSVAPLSVLFAGPAGWELGPATASRIGFLPLVTVGILLTSRTADVRARSRMLLDGAASSTALLLIAWAVVVEPLLAGVGDGSSWVLGALGLPLGAATLAVYSLNVLLQEFRPERRLMPALYIGGLVGIALADARWVQLALGSRGPVAALDSGGWTVGFLLIAGAAAAYRGTTVDAARFVAARWTVYAPYVAVLAAGTTLGVQVLLTRRCPLPEVGMAVLIVALVLVRQLLLVAQNRDLVLELGRRERALRHQARHDPLTGLGNRTLLMERLDHVLTDRPDGAPGVALLLLDLDDFKLVNDTLGHHAGDELLVLVAGRLRAALRAGDVAVRLGGDEFAVLMETSGDHALAVGRGLRTAFQEPFHVADHPLSLSASIGIVDLDGTGPDVDATVLLKGADMAMYEAKRRGKNDVQVFTPALGGGAPAALGTRAELAEALDAGDVGVVHLPVVRAGDGEVVLVEAHARWMHPRRGVISGPELVRTAGRGRLASRLTEEALTAACAQVPDAPVLAWVTLSGAQLVEPGLPHQVRAALGRHRLDAARLVIAADEASLLGDLEGAAAVLGQVRTLGCQLAIDGFGAVYGALSPFAVLPFDLVALDARLVHEPDRFEHLVTAVVDVARNSGARVVAHGVDRPEHWAAVEAMGVELMQGPLADDRAAAARPGAWRPAWPSGSPSSGSPSSGSPSFGNGLAAAAVPAAVLRGGASVSPDFAGGPRHLP